MRVIITGATGFVGKALSSNLLDSGWEVIALSRSQKKAQSVLGDKATVIEWDGTTSSGWARAAENADAIINLAGANLSSRYWTSSYKKEMWDSRVYAGRAMAQAVMRAKRKPKMLIQASAIGYYGSRKDEILDEHSGKGEGFLADLVQAWETSTEAVEAQGVPRLIIRSGVILGKGSVIISLLQLPFKLYGGGYPGSGKQWFSWIHLEDQIRIIRFLMEGSQIKGIVNLASPEPVKMKEFCRLFGKVLHKPMWVRVPAVVLKLALGDMAKETVLASQKIFPKKLLEVGYQFKYPNLEPALADSLN
ncbi:MAG: hypothetical protein AMJ53_00260 [Gammaproteobacteria bacterium SG8_11]|nr:MAG: hypothetical protein AMJ53_00260 [Gammaproteobacteria bacterium SG8_11]